MSNVPDAPLIFKISEYVLSALIPSYSVYYLSIEASLMYIVHSCFLLVTIGLSPIFVVLGSFSYLILILIMYKTDKGNISQIDVPYTMYIGILIICLLPYLPFILLNTQYMVYYILPIAIYIISLAIRSQRFRINGRMYTNEDSDANHLWKKACMQVESGYKNLNRNSSLRSYFWFRRAETTYKKISNSDTREMERRAAESLSKVFQTLSATQYTYDKTRDSLHKASKREYGNAIEYLESRICDSCNRVYSSNNCTRFQDDKGRSKIYCENCFYSYKRRSRKSRRSRQSKRTNRQSKTVNKDNNIGVTKAMSILDINKLRAENLTEDELNKHYREKVKSAHPDVGGSEQEFKRVRKAKDVLDKHLDES